MGASEWGKPPNALGQKGYRKKKKKKQKKTKKNITPCYFL
jgi:hypothetical protein